MANIIFILAIALCVRFLYNKKQELKLNRKVNTNIQKTAQIRNLKKINNVVEIPTRMNKTRYVDQDIQDTSSYFNLYYLAMHGLFIICLVYILMI